MVHTCNHIGNTKQSHKEITHTFMRGTEIKHKQALVHTDIDVWQPVYLACVRA